MNKCSHFVIVLYKSGIEINVWRLLFYLPQNIEINIRCLKSIYQILVREATLFKYYISLSTLSNDYLNFQPLKIQGLYIKKLLLLMQKVALRFVTLKVIDSLNRILFSVFGYLIWLLMKTQNYCILWQIRSTKIWCRSI